MPTIRSMCPRCGTVDMQPDEILLDVRARTYRYVCPGHGDLVVKRADDVIVKLLRGADVREVNGEMDEADVAEFTKMLEDDEAIWRAVKRE